MFLAAWGQERYGEWLTVSAAVAYASMADLGFSSYVVNRLAGLHACAQHADFQRTLHSALRFSLRVSASLFGGGALLVSLAPIDVWLRMEHLARFEVRALVLILALQVIGAVPRGLIMGLYRAIGEYPRGVTLANLQRLSGIVGTGVLLLFGADLIAIGLWQLAPLVFTTWWALVDLQRRHPQIEVGVRAAERGLARSFLAPSLGFLAVQASLVLVLQGSVLSIGFLFGSAAVALFVSLRTLANLVRQIAGSVSNALWPELTHLAAERRWETLSDVHRVSVKTLSTLSLAAGGFLVLAGADLLELWTGGRLVFDGGLMLAFVGLLVLQAPWTASSYVLLATNRHGELARRQLAAGVMGLALGTATAIQAGPAGLLVGLLAGELAFCSLAVPREVARLVGDSWRGFALDVFGRGALVLILFVALLIAAAPLDALSPLARIVAAGLLSPAGAFLLAWRLWLSPSERERIRRIAFPERSRALPLPPVPS